MNKRAIVYTVDDNTECFLQLVMSVKSVRRCYDGDIDIYILTNKPRPWMYGLYDTKVVDVSQYIKDYELDKTGIVWRKHPVSPMLLFRLLIPSLPFLKSYDKVLYLDADTEVWHKEFFDIFSKDDDAEVIGVKDSLSKSGIRRRIAFTRSRGGLDWVDPPDIYNRWDELIQGGGKYCNSGVLVFNLKNIPDGFDSRLKYIIRKVKELKPYYSDQDTINVYFKVFVVDDRRYNMWGYQTETALLRHYVGNDRRRFLTYPRVTQSRPNDVLDGIKKNPDLGVLSGIVDHVYVLVDGSNPANYEIFSEWLSKNKITGFTKIDVSPSGLYSRLIAVAPCEKGIKPEHMDNWIGHYKAIVDAISSGYEKIAIFEDAYVPRGAETLVQDIKSDFDIVLCTDSGSFTRSINFKASSSKGYFLNKRCMIDMRRLFESLWDPSIPGQKLRYVYKWLDSRVLTKERAYVRK